MKILWITNVLFPDICKEIGRQAPVTGGWMKSLAETLVEVYPDVELAVAALYGSGKPLLEKKIGKVTYFCLPFYEYETDYNPKMERVWKEVKSRFNPDVVHIHGTEYPYGLAYVRANGVQNAVVSIQGLVGVYARYSLGQIPVDTLKRYRTLYDYLKRSVLKMPGDMEKQGRLEVDYLSTFSHVIGRTDWDKEHAWAINPDCTYHFCNETLRKPFYDEKNRWSIQECEPYSIFLSQAHKPIKGIHKVIEALPMILRHYPDTEVYVAGADFTNVDGLVNRLKFGTYANYIKHLMQEKGVADRFHFLGKLDENQMANQYRKAHVFVCPSSIENSPNSLGEAQLIGTPCVASYVGGVPAMLEHGKSGLMYRFEEHEMLAAAVCRIFADADLACRLSQNERMEAAMRHDGSHNARRTYHIYTDIIKRK